MKYLLQTLIFLAISQFAFAQNIISMPYEPSAEHPFGQVNPEAPEQVADFAPMIGHWHCKSQGRNPDGSWQDTTMMEWRFKYIMNGTAVQDEVWRDEKYAGGVRQYQADSATWVVSYFSYPSVPYTPGVWHGERSDNEIILFKDQKAPNGMEGYYRITFSGFAENHFDWIGEWVDKGQTIVYPTWRIGCTRVH